MPVFCDVSAEEQVNQYKRTSYNRIFKLNYFNQTKIEALREYFKSKKAKLDDNINIADIPEHLRDLIKNLDSLYTSDIVETGKLT